LSVFYLDNFIQFHFLYWVFYGNSLACAFQSFPFFFEYEKNTPGEYS